MGFGSTGPHRTGEVVKVEQVGGVWVYRSTQDRGGL